MAFSVGAFGVQHVAVGRAADARQHQFAVARQAQRLALAQHLRHAFDVGGGVAVAGGGFGRAQRQAAMGCVGIGHGSVQGLRFGVGGGCRVGVQHLGRGDGGLHHKGASHAHHAAVYLGPVHQHFGGGWFVVGNGLQRDVRHQPAHFFALAVLLALVDEAALRAGLRVFEVVVREGGCQQPLAGQCEWHARCVAGDPAAAPLFGDVSGGAAAAGGVQH